MDNLKEASNDSLRESFSSIPFKIVKFSGRFILSNNLDRIQPLPAKNGTARDYRGLAELMGFQFNDIKKFERYSEPTMKILESWETQRDATLDKLINYLEDMERYDVINELMPVLEKDIKSQNERRLQNIPVDEIISFKEDTYYRDDLQIYTCDDVRTGECTSYDAYVCYAEDDTDFVEELASHLEPPGNQFKLCIHGRDMLPGCADIESKINLIKQRCRLMLVILSHNFLESSACAFQASFAASLAIEQRKRMLITLVITPCEIPPLLKYLSHLDFTKPFGRQWLWNKLVTSLIEARMRRNIPFEQQYSAASESQNTTNEPTVTFPETTQYVPLPIDNAITEVETSAQLASVQVLEHNLENTSSTNMSQLMKKMKSLNVKKKNGSSSASNTSNSFLSRFSSNTSGFQSLSDSEMGNSSARNLSNTYSGGKKSSTQFF